MTLTAFPSIEIYYLISVHR